MDFEPDTKYQVQMRISGGHRVIPSAGIPTSSFNVRADPGLEVADDGVPYGEAFDLQVSPALMSPPRLTIAYGTHTVTLNWQASPAP